MLIFFIDWVDLYKKKIAEITRNSYELTHSLIKDYFKNEKMRKITPRHYQAFINEVGKTRGFESVSRIHIQIRACVKIAIYEGLIESDFTHSIELYYTIPKKKEKDKYLNYKDSKKLLSYVIDNLDKSMTNYLILLGLTSGLRYGEMMGLTRNDFDFDTGVIIVEKTWGYHQSSENPAGFGTTKNKQSVRNVALDDRTLEVFKQLFEREAVHEDNEHELVFFNPQAKYKVFSNSFTNRYFKKTLRKLKIKPEISIHGLRHTHASILIYKKEVTVNYISERLGHSNVTVTLDRYSHVLEELRTEDTETTRQIFASMYQSSNTNV
ncbi:tyrosine-type recombinase/integrase [Pueribacillus sp. YX66]|uniref:tyrosine-type recombinase/integrase n=1 Tax=Pueribacillus sp. YX66 TaxID=3229242 RepID=UPI00358D330A